MAGYSGNADALGRPLAPEGLIFRPSPRLPGFVEFGEAAFRAGAPERGERPRYEAGFLGSLVYRPMVFKRNQIGWVAACAWRARAKTANLAALKRGKRELDQRLIREAAELLSALVRQLMAAVRRRLSPAFPVAIRSGLTALVSASRRPWPRTVTSPSFRFSPIALALA